MSKPISQTRTRTIKKPGVDDKKMAALESLGRAKQGASAMDQYNVTIFILYIKIFLGIAKSIQ